MNEHQKDLIRREAFVQGFITARDPKTPHATLLLCDEAERAWIAHLAQRAR